MTDLETGIYRVYDGRDVDGDAYRALLLVIQGKYWMSYFYPYDEAIEADTLEPIEVRELESTWTYEPWKGAIS